jgi:cytochrome c biogenesis protein
LFFEPVLDKNTSRDTNLTTAGVALKVHRPWLVGAAELFSSMRFAISLLTLLSVASIIGTVLKQNEPMTNYVNQFGPFWFDVFDKLSLYSVYSAWWFLLILAFLVLSTSLCITRNAPKMIKDMRSWRENVREQSLRNFHHRAEWTTSQARPEMVQSLAAQIQANGYKVKIVEKGEASLIAAKQGAANKWGYIFAHSAIVIICVGGLLDSDLPIRLQQWMYGKTPFVGNGIIAQIPQQHRLGIGNPTFRGNTLIPEGASSNTAIIPRQNGVLIQELPFTLKLNKFIIEHYSTGMPKLFASEVMVTDHETGKQFPAVIKVNQPLVYKGLAVYQSSFEDGGSKLKLAAYRMKGSDDEPFSLAGEIGETTPLQATNGGEFTIEWSGFRPFNVENMAQAGTDARAVNLEQPLNRQLMEGLNRHLGSAAKGENTKDLKNVGPSVQYKLRDKTGQAREYHNYMLPVMADGSEVFLTGMRESPSEPFRFLRIPADENNSVDEWMRIRAAIMNPQLRDEAARRYAQRAFPQTQQNEILRTQLQQSALKGLSIFAGDDNEAGFVAVSRFLERLPAEEQEKAADIFIKILNGSLWDLWQVARERDGLKALTPDENNSKFLQASINAAADAFFYGAPVYLQLREFDEVKASVLQVTRSPGKNVVYLGCLLLVLGIFSMLYIRERRLWVWVKSGGDNGSHALMALSTQRKTLDFEKEFEALKAQIVPQAAQPEGQATAGK